MDFTNHLQGEECITETKNDEPDGTDIGNLIMHYTMHFIFMSWEKIKKENNQMWICYNHDVPYSEWPHQPYFPQPNNLKMFPTFESCLGVRFCISGYKTRFLESVLCLQQETFIINNSGHHQSPCSLFVFFAQFLQVWSYVVDLYFWPLDGVQL